MFEMTSEWRYEIQHGPDGEANYAWVYNDKNEMVCTARTHHAIEIVRSVNGLPEAIAALEEIAGLDFGVCGKIASDTLTKLKG